MLLFAFFSFVGYTAAALNSSCNLRPNLYSKSGTTTKGYAKQIKCHPKWAD